MPTDVTPASRGSPGLLGHSCACVTSRSGDPSRAGAGLVTPTVGTSVACSSIRMVLISAAAPAAASAWPMFDFTEPRPMPAPPAKAALAASSSIRSPSSVPVPCASRYCAADGSRPAAAHASVIAAVCWSTPGAVKPTLPAPSLVTAVPRITARTGSPSASASSSRRSTSTPTPLPGTVPAAFSSKGRQRPSGEKIPPW